MGGREEERVGSTNFADVSLCETLFYLVVLNSEGVSRMNREVGLCVA